MYTRYFIRQTRNIVSFVGKNRVHSHFARSEIRNQIPLLFTKSFYLSYSTTVTKDSSEFYAKREENTNFAENTDDMNLSFLTISRACELLRSRTISKEDIEKIAFSFIYRNDIETKDLDYAVRSLYRIKKYNQLLQFFQLLISSKPTIQLSTSSMEFLFDALIETKKYHFLNFLYSHCSNEDKKKWGIQSRYTYCIIANHQLENAHTFLTRMQREEYTIPIANSYMIRSLYEGGYNSECVKLMKGLLPLDPTYAILGDTRCLSAAILAACDCKQPEEALSFFSVCNELKVPVEPKALNKIAEIYTLNPSWKKEYTQKTQGKKYSNKQLMQLLAQTRLNQFIEGSQAMKTYFPYSINGKKDLVTVQLGNDWRESQKLHLFTVLNEISSTSTERSVKGRVVVRDVDDRVSIKRFLRSELYPSIPFDEDNNQIIIPLSSIQYWKNHRNDPVL